MLSPMFIDSTKLSYIEDDNQTVTIAQDCIIANTIKFNIEIVSLMTNEKGWCAVSTKDSSVNLFDIQNIPNETIYINEIPSESDNSINFKSDSIWMSQNIYYGTISFFRDSII